MTAVWDGDIRGDALHEEAARVRHDLANAAKAYEWSQVLETLERNPALVNTTRPGGASLYAPLHHAAHGGASVEIVEALIMLGAWRTLQNARGERPVDVAERQGHRHLLGILKPECKHAVPAGVLLKIQQHFHAVIRGRIDEQLPDLICSGIAQGRSAIARRWYMLEPIASATNENLTGRRGVAQLWARQA